MRVQCVYMYIFLIFISRKKKSPFDSLFLETLFLILFYHRFYHINTLVLRSWLLCARVVSLQLFSAINARMK